MSAEGSRASSGRKHAAQLKFSITKGRARARSEAANEGSSINRIQESIHASVLSATITGAMSGLPIPSAHGC